MADNGTRIFAGRLKDGKALITSSSGGAFTALSDSVLERGGAVVCSVYDRDSASLSFKLIETKPERDKAKGSKYFQSDPGNIFREAKKWLSDNPDKELLFIGMGCQADGFRRFAEVSGIRDRVLIADIICTGVPSPKLWKEYAATLGKITFLTFKDKRSGWKKPTPIAIVNGKEVSVRPFVKLFYSHTALRPSCYKCNYAKIQRKSDITIGDFWHIEDKHPDFYSDCGNSLFLIHTEKGMELFNRASSAMDIMESTEKNCWQNMLERPTPKPGSRDDFWAAYRAHGITGAIEFANKVPAKAKVKKLIKKFI